MAHGDTATGRLVRVDGETPQYHDEGAAFLETAIVTHDGFPYLVTRDSETHGDFHLLRARSHQDQKTGKTFYTINTEPQGVVYQPLHESVKPEDVIGARYAEDTGTHWIFAACSPREQLDFAAEAAEFARGLFDRAIQQSNAKGMQSGVNSVRQTAFAKSTALITFAGLVESRVRDVVVNEVLGYYHKHPHHDHKRQLAKDAISRQRQVYRQNRETDSDSRNMLAYTSDTVDSVLILLAASPVIETRHERYKRFLKLSSKGQDPLGGFEYIFTASETGDAITVPGDLPDGSWPFDDPRLAKGLKRGSQKYYDGFPLTLTFSRPWGIRFARKVGTTTWTQEPAFRVYGGF